MISKHYTDEELMQLYEEERRKEQIIITAEQDVEYQFLLRTMEDTGTPGNSTKLNRGGITPKEQRPIQLEPDGVGDSGE